MSDSTLEIIKAWVAALKADAGVAALVGARVYDQPPQDPGYPNVTFGPLTGEPWDTDGNLGWEASIQIDIWSRAPGKPEAARIMAAIKAVLHRSSITMDTQTNYLTMLELNRILDWDGATRHGVQRFRVLTHQ
jgi:hypothetical protein